MGKSSCPRGRADHFLARGTIDTDGIFNALPGKNIRWGLYSKMLPEKREKCLRSEIYGNEF